MPKTKYALSSSVLKIFSHPTRLLIVFELLKGKRCVQGINKILKVPQPNISQHLAILKANRIVESKQKGKEMCYCLKKTELVTSLLEFLKENKLV